MNRTREIESEAQEHAAAGALFLDERRPDWAEEINPTTLKMTLPCHCILGQLYGVYDRGFDELVNEGHSPYGRRAVELGFITGGDADDAEDDEEGEDDGSDWLALDNAWLEEIAKRRS